MFDTWSTRGALAATTALAALGLVMIVPQFAQPPLGGLTGTPRLVQEEAPATALPAPAPSRGGPGCSRRPGSPSGERTRSASGGRSRRDV